MIEVPKLVISTSPEKTEAVGAALAGALGPGDVLALLGELGSGKTCFTRGLARGLGVSDSSVNSPTFVLLNVYQGRLPIYHFDAYRLKDSGSFLDLGAEEFLYGKGVCVLEWADRVADALPEDRLEIHFAHKGESERALEFRPFGQRGQELMAETWPRFQKS